MDILADVEVVKKEAAGLRLLNPPKLEIICDACTTRDSILSSLPGALAIDPMAATIQGFPIDHL